MDHVRERRAVLREKLYDGKLSRQKLLAQDEGAEQSTLVKQSVQEFTNLAKH